MKKTRKGYAMYSFLPPSIGSTRLKTIIPIMAPLKDLLNEDESPSYLSPSSSDDERKYSTGSTNSTSPSEISGSDDDSSEMLVCQWQGCSQVFPQPELLYHHLCNDHVGRKSQKNLQLNCNWGNCNAKTVKRDHITSHLRVHVPLKPFGCSTCGKKFKRPQDLKKHLRVHLDDGTTIKRKRGPKVGSKRVSKKQQDQQPRSHSLPPITFDNFLREELNRYQPVYTSQLGDRLQAVLPPPPQPAVSKTMFAQQPVSPISQDPSIVQQQSSQTPDFRVAAGFFTTLSNDMTRRLPVFPRVSTGQPAGTANIAPGLTTTPPSINMYPQVTQLPPIHTHLKQPLSFSASGNITPPMANRFDSYNRLPHFNGGHMFSVHQKNNGTAAASTEEVIDLLSELKVEEEEEEGEFNDFVDTLAKVNVIKDYLICSLLETEYSDEEDREEENENLDVVLPATEINKLSKYPEVVV